MYDVYGAVPLGLAELQTDRQEIQTIEESTNREKCVTWRTQHREV